MEVAHFKKEQRPTVLSECHKEPEAGDFGRHARANLVERTDRVIKTQIIAFIEEKHNEWDKHIYELMFVYNTAVHESSEMTLAFM